MILYYIHAYMIYIYKMFSYSYILYKFLLLTFINISNIYYHIKNSLLFIKVKNFIYSLMLYMICYIILHISQTL